MKDAALPTLWPAASTKAIRSERPRKESRAPRKPSAAQAAGIDLERGAGTGVELAPTRMWVPALLRVTARLESSESPALQFAEHS